MAAIVPPVRLILLVPALAVMVCPVMEPDVQVGMESPLGVLITNPFGRTSEKLTPVRGVALGLAKVNVSVLAPPRIIVAGEKALESVGVAVAGGQPVIVMLSIFAFAPVLTVPAPRK